MSSLYVYVRITYKLRISPPPANMNRHLQHCEENSKLENSFTEILKKITGVKECLDHKSSFLILERNGDCFLHLLLFQASSPSPAELAPIIKNYELTLGDVTLLIKMQLLPISTLLIITGMSIFNDLIDADLDRTNGKIKRPIPSGNVSKRSALVLIIVTNLIGVTIALLISDITGIFFAFIIALIGVLYSTPKISLKDRFMSFVRKL